jgi:ATP-dependent DNA ligase
VRGARRSDVVKLTDGFPAAKSNRLMQSCAAMDLEGVVMKRKGTLYSRSKGWLKVPIRHRDEFVVGGYLPSRRGFTTLILGQYRNNGSLTYPRRPRTAAPRRLSASCRRSSARMALLPHSVLRPGGIRRLGEQPWVV